MIKGEERRILKKFVTPQADEFYLPLRSELACHSDELSRIGSAFCKGLETAMVVASIPFLLTQKSVAHRVFTQIFIAERIRALKDVDPGQPLTKELQDRAYTKALSRHRAIETSAEGLTAATDEIIAELGVFVDDQDTSSAAAELLNETVVILWGTLEVLISDTIRHVLNRKPALAAKVASVEPAKRHFSSRTFSLESLAKNDFNLQNSMGDILLSERSLDSLLVMRDVLSVVAPRESRVHQHLGRDDLWRLWQARHLIVHRRGTVDQGYIEKTGSKDLVVGQLLPVDSNYIDEAAMICRDVGTAFLETWRHPELSLSQ